MEFVYSEFLGGFDNTVSMNISCCRYAMTSKKRVGILAKGEYNVGTITTVWWDDLEDRISMKTDAGKNVTLSGSQISLVRLV
mgnify:CR=1 FL=1|tara:strand:+ start:131 stop:376 length:246 start_codon:yes stop_codon:yes gene_type:complete